jgi:hypothetical protein
MNMWYPVFIPNGLDQKTLETYRKKAFLEFYLRPSIIFNYLMNIRSIADINKILKGFFVLLYSTFKRNKSN